MQSPTSKYEKLTLTYCGYKINYGISIFAFLANVILLFQNINDIYTHQVYLLIKVECEHDICEVYPAAKIYACATLPSRFVQIDLRHVVCYRTMFIYLMEQIL